MYDTSVSLRYALDLYVGDYCDLYKIIYVPHRLKISFWKVTESLSKKKKKSLKKYADYKPLRNPWYIWKLDAPLHSELILSPMYAA